MISELPRPSQPVQSHTSSLPPRTAPKLPAPQGRSKRSSSNCTSHSASGPAVMLAALLPPLVLLASRAVGPLLDCAVIKGGGRRTLHCRRSEARWVEM